MAETESQVPSIPDMSKKYSKILDIHKVRRQIDQSRLLLKTYS